MKYQDPIKLAPIIIFTYKRLDTLIKSVEALQKCMLANESLVYIYSDGPRKEDDIEEVQKVRDYIKGISGFKNVITKFSEENKGLAKSIIGGVTEIINEHGSIIVLEDDLIPSTNFLTYMNAALSYYKDNYKVFSISGYTSPINIPKNYEYENYFTLRGSSWGWATWIDCWQDIDWEVSDYKDFLNDKKRQKNFNKMGSDMTKMLGDQMKGRINSWAIRWCYDQFRKDKYTVFPLVSKISNVGFGGDATHTEAQDEERYRTSLDASDKHTFSFKPNIELEDVFMKQFLSKFSIKTRVYYTIRKRLGI